MKRLSILLLLMGFLSVSLFAQKDIPVDPRVKMGKLDNGLTYYIQQNEKPEDRVEIRLAVKTGSIMEDDDQLGLAHFVEHMAFNGTEHFEKNELINFLETVGTRFGADLNAYTSFDETVYMLQLRTDDPEIMDKGLLVFEDWAGGLAFNPEEIDKERGVVVSEWRTRLSASQRMQQEYLPVLYKDSRYAERLPIGEPEIIETADYDVVKRFYDDWYRPELMAVVVVGDIDVNEMEKEIRERFSDLENPENPRERVEYDVPRHDETLISIVSDKEESFTRARVTYKHDHVPTEDLDDYRQSLTRTLYNQMLNARLNELSQQADPPFLFAFSGYSRDIGDIDTYSSSATTAEGEALSGLEAVLTENERVKRFGFTESELERAKTDLLKGAERRAKEKDKTDSRRLAMRYVYHFLNDNPIPGPDQSLKLYEKMLPSIQLSDVNALADKWVTDENRVVVITGPENEEFPMPKEDEVRMLLKEVGMKELEPYEDEVSDAPLLAGEFTEGSIVNKKEYKEVGVTEWELSNGVKVMLKPTDFKNDEIMMRATSVGGHSNYDLETYPSASNATSIVSESGVGEFSAIQLEKKLTGKTVYVNPYISELYEGMSGGASPEDLETLFQLVYLYFTAPREDGEAFESYMTKQKAIYGNLMSNPNYFFFDQSMKIKYDNHPRRGFPTLEDMEKVDLETAISVYKDRFEDASDFTFIFVGNFDKATMKKFAVQYLANLPTAERKDMWKDVDADMVDGQVEKIFSKGKAPKTQVDITFHGDAEWSPDNLYVMQSMVQALRIKLRESMREDKGGVYGVSVRGSMSRIPDEDYSINISFNADPEMANDLIQTAVADIEDVMDNGVEDTYITKVKETQRQSAITDMQENRFWMQQLERAVENDLDPNNITMDALEEKIAMLDNEAIKKAANQYFNFDNMIKIVMFPDEVENVEP